MTLQRLTRRRAYYSCLSLLASLAVMAQPAKADLGESRSDIEKRYGKPLPPSKNSSPNDGYYRQGDLDIGVLFKDGKSIFERFDSSKMNLDRAKEIMSRMSKGIEWETLPADESEFLWEIASLHWRAKLKTWNTGDRVFTVRDTSVPEDDEW